MAYYNGAFLIPGNNVLLFRLRQQLAEAQKETEELKQSYKDLMSDMDSYVNQESEHLNFSQKLSDETVRLQSENLSLGDEVRD